MIEANLPSETESVATDAPFGIYEGSNAHECHAMPMRDKSRILTLAELTSVVAEIAPPRLAESWDNVGLQIGDAARSVRRVMTCLEVTPPTLAEAKRRKADTIVAHHPLIFRPLEAIVAGDPAQRLVAALVRAEINLIAAHTNLDSAIWGTNQTLAETCGLRVTGPLVAQTEPGPYKFVVFTPKGYEGAVTEAIVRGGGGRIGAYTHCTFRSPGVGTFRGGEGSKPFIGQAGRLEEAEEYRLEAVVPRPARESVLREVLEVHPYDEPAYEFYILADQPGGAGLGCVAEPNKPLGADALVARIKRRMGLKRVRISGPMRATVRRVAICTGSGGSFLARAVAAGAQLYLTGEASYHHGIEAHGRGITMIEVGHFESERIVAEPLARRLLECRPVKEAAVRVFAAKKDLQPFRSH